MTRRTALLALPFLSSIRPALSFGGQGGRKRVSPHENVSGMVNNSKIEIAYGRPYLKGRTMSELTPDGKVWRLGADEATKLTASGPVTLNSNVKLAPGSYSLFAITGPDKWTMIVNKTAEQWGAFSYDQGQDLARFDLPVQKLSAPVEEFTIKIEGSGDTKQLSFAWGSQKVVTSLS